MYVLFGNVRAVSSAQILCIVQLNQESSVFLLKDQKKAKGKSTKKTKTLVCQKRPEKGAVG